MHVLCQKPSSWQVFMVLPQIFQGTTWHCWCCCFSQQLCLNSLEPQMQQHQLVSKPFFSYMLGPHRQCTHVNNPIPSLFSLKNTFLSVGEEREICKLLYKESPFEPTITLQSRVHSYEVHAGCSLSLDISYKLSWTLEWERWWRQLLFVNVFHWLPTLSRVLCFRGRKELLLPHMGTPCLQK